jgi:DNA ligase-1
MKNIITLDALYKRDTKGKLRIWEIQWGYTDDSTVTDPKAGTRTVSGLVDGQKVTSGWNISLPKNVGKVNETTSLTQAKSEAQSMWDIKAEKEYFNDVLLVDTYDKFKPMLAHDYTKTKVPVTQGWVQPKLDGIRCVVNKDGMWTRSGKAINSCPHIWESLKGLMEQNPHYILDGELYNHELKADFNKIISLVRKVKSTPADMEEAKSLVEYHVYDMFDKSAPEMSFINRIKQAYWCKNDYVKIVTTDYCETQDELDELYSQYTEDGYEGQMVRQNTPYENKRSKSLLKRKEFITEEYDVVSVEEGKGNWAGYAKRFVLKLPNGAEFGAGVRGNQAQLEELWNSDTKPTWATLRYFEMTPDGVPRFPVVIDYGVGTRTD